jgi:hypothetical protein
MEFVKFMTETWYLLFVGTTADGMGDGNYVGRTTDKSTARKHYDECKSPPYSVGKVIVVTDTKHRRIGFDYGCESL